MQDVDIRENGAVILGKKSLDINILHTEKKNVQKIHTDIAQETKKISTQEKTKKHQTKRKKSVIPAVHTPYYNQCPFL